MRRRSSTGGKSLKAGRRKATAPKRSNAAKAVHPQKFPDASLNKKITQLTRERDEALEQLSAASQVLKVISSSPGELEPVFNAMLDNAVRICEAQFGAMHRFEGESFYVAAMLNLPPALSNFLRDRGSRKAIPGSDMDQLYKSKRLVHTLDMLEAPVPSPPAKLAGGRTQLAVPMLKDDELVGAIVIYRQEVRPFADKQIELVQNFAAQAVIAIENTRLLTELRESLEQQTATSEVLKVISSSSGELASVFDAVLANATRICQASFGIMLLLEGDIFRRVALYNAPPEYVKFAETNPILDPRKAPSLYQVLETKSAVQVADMAAAEPEAPTTRFGQARTLLSVPMLSEIGLIGVIAIYRREVRPFTGKQTELLSNFAAQAVIAIENVRLLSELRQRTTDLSEALEQQTATSEVLQVISSSPGELEAVFDSILHNAVRICGARFGNLALFDGSNMRLTAMHNAPSEFEKIRRANPIVPLDRSVLGTVVKTGKKQHIIDLAAEEPYSNSVLVKVAGARTALAVPMLKDGQLIGVINIYRQESRPFSDKQVELLEDFAAQAVIAIENARLLNELRERTADLTESLEDLRAAQDRLVQTEKLASLGQLTAGIAHEIKNPLNFVNNFSAVSVELIDELRQALALANLDNKLSTEISEIADMLQGNLDKVVQHGNRADSIVKNMLLHSRAGSGENRTVDINAIVEESLNLAYHGARAEKQGFNITLERSFDPAAGEVDLFPQEITRVLLNLISNGFYAATKRKAETNGGDYEPTLAATTKNLGDSVEITIRDNGTGISPEVKEKLFNPFFTTKPAGEGTGLGLSISHDIIVKQHGGSIEVDTQPGEFTEFRIVLPRGAATIAKSGERT